MILKRKILTFKISSDFYVAQQKIDNFCVNYNPDSVDTKSMNWLQKDKWVCEKNGDEYTFSRYEKQSNNMMFNMYQVVGSLKQINADLYFVFRIIPSYFFYSIRLILLILFLILALFIVIDFEINPFIWLSVLIGIILIIHFAIESARFQTIKKFNKILRLILKTKVMQII